MTVGFQFIDASKINWPEDQEFKQSLMRGLQQIEMKMYNKYADFRSYKRVMRKQDNQFGTDAILFDFASFNTNISRDVKLSEQVNPQLLDCFSGDWKVVVESMINASGQQVMEKIDSASLQETESYTLVINSLGGLSAVYFFVCTYRFPSGDVRKHVDTVVMTGMVVTTVEASRDTMREAVKYAVAQLPGTDAEIKSRVEKMLKVVESDSKFNEEDLYPEPNWDEEFN